MVCGSRRWCVVVIVVGGVWKSWSWMVVCGSHGRGWKS